MGDWVLLICHWPADLFQVWEPQGFDRELEKLLRVCGESESRTESGLEESYFSHIMRLLSQREINLFYGWSRNLSGLPHLQ